MYDSTMNVCTCMYTVYMCMWNVVAYTSGADPDPQDRVCTGEIAINIKTKSAYRIASYTSPFLYGLWLVMVGKGGWRERNVGKRGYLYLVTKRHYALRCQLSI